MFSQKRIHCICLTPDRFRWVSLQLQNICDSQRMKHEEDIRAELGKLPKTLNESYQVIYERIMNAGETSQKIADSALKWLLCAKRRLSPSELIVAVAINRDGEYISLSERELLDICCNLLVLDEELNTFRFAHLSVREYLEDLKDFNNIEANTLVLQRCVDVYLFEQQDQCNLAMTQNSTLKSYATSYWPFHCQSLGSNLEEKVKNHIKSFLIQNSNLAPSFQKWLLDLREAYFSVLNEDSYLDHVVECFSSPPSLLFLTCCFGLTWLMHDLNQLENISWNQLNYFQSPALDLAIKWGNEEILRFLLEHTEVDVNIKNRYDQTPLLLTAREGHEAAVRVLLERDDVDVNFKSYNGQTPLSLAAEEGHEAVVRLLLERNDVDINSKEASNSTPLAQAAYHGHKGVVELLLEHDEVDVNLKNFIGTTPLTWAAKFGHEAVVKLLLKRDDVDVNSIDYSGRTPLGWAAMHGHEAVMRLLLERNDLAVNRTDLHGQTPLARAAIYGHESMMRLLLNRGDIDVNSKDVFYCTPLAQAALHGHEAIVRLLLERDDVIIYSRDTDGLTPRDRAKRKGYTEIVRLFDLGRKRGEKGMHMEGNAF